jgi:hypothetical protein
MKLFSSSFIYLIRKKGSEIYFLVSCHDEIKKKGNFLTFTSVNSDSPFASAQIQWEALEVEILLKIVVYDVHIFSIPSSNLLFGFVSQSFFVLAC